MTLVIAIMHLYNFFIASVHSFFYILFKKSGIDKSTEWSTIPACPILMYFFLTGVILKGLIFENFVFNICVRFVISKFVL